MKRYGLFSGIVGVILFVAVSVQAQTVKGRVAYTTVDNNQTSIQIINLGGATGPGGSTNGSGPTWSPDGAKIAFSSRRDGGTHRVYILDLTTGATTRLAISDDGDERDPSWSPDGTRIVFWSTRNNPQGNSEIYSVKADGIDLRRLTNNDYADMSPVFSPDGSRLAFESGRDSGEGNIYVMGANGGNERRVTNHLASDRYPSWSPDGAKIAFSSNRGGDYDIYTVDAGGGSERLLVSRPGHDTCPAWSPDGSKIVFSGSGGLFMVSAIDGSGLTSIAGYGEDPEWAPLLPEITVSTPTIGLGNVNISSSGTATFSITNTGGKVLTVSSIVSSNTRFTVAPSTADLTGNTSGVITITFNPASSGLDIGTLTINHNVISSGPVVVSVSGNGIVPPPLPPPAAPIVSLSTNSLAFGNANLGQSVQLPVILKNTGTGLLIVSSMSTGSGEFTFSPNTFPVNIVAGDSVVVVVTFVPSSAGAKVLNLTINHNASGSPTPVVLSGVGHVAPIVPPPSVPIINAPISLVMDTTFIGSFSQKTLVVSNTGLSNMVVSNITRSGADSTQFAVSPTAFTISPGISQTVTVNFVPASAGGKATILGIYHNASGSPRQVVVSGVGRISASPPPSTAPAILLPDSLTMDSTAVGSSSQKTVMIANIGTASLAVTSIAVVGTNASMFNVSPTNAAVATGASQGLTIGFTPISTGAKLALLIVSHNAAGSPDTVRIIGVGKAPPPTPLFSVFPISLALDSVLIGSTSQRIFTVSNTGVLILNVSSVTVSGTDRSQFSVLPVSASIGVGSSQIFIVTFAPTSAGAKLASLKLAHNAASSPDSVGVTGIGKAPPPVPLFGVAPIALVMDSTNVGLTSQKTVTVTNSGAIALVVSLVAISGINTSRFSVLPTSASIGVGSSQIFIVTFAPDSAGTKSASLVFTHNATGSPSSVVLSGVGKSTTPAPPPPSPAISVTPTSLAMDSTLVGSFSQKTFTVSNAGTANLVIFGITRSGADSTQFTVSPTAFTVSPSGSQAVVVNFAPVSSGPKPTILNIVHNAAGSPTQVVVSGVGKISSPPVQPPIQPPPTATVSDEMLKIDFALTSQKGVAPLNVKFTVNFTPSSGAPLRRLIFYPGNGDSLVNNAYDSIVYQKPGIYTPSVIAYFEDGRVRSAVKPNYVTVVEPAPVIDFTASPLSGVVPLSVIFKARNIGGPVTSYTWNLGDTTVAATADSLFHRYVKGGTYTIILIATGPGGTDTKTKNGYIVLSEPPPPPPTPLPPSADFNGSGGKIGFDDFFLFAEVFGQPLTAANKKFDLNNDGVIDLNDFFIFAEKFGT